MKNNREQLTSPDSNLLDVEQISVSTLTFRKQEKHTILGYGLSLNTLHHPVIYKHISKWDDK